MEHIAILNPRYHYLPRILDGTKSIESRWYVHRVTPWDRISVGDIVYFKDSGKPITVKASVSFVLQLDHPSQEKLKEIITKYGRQITAGSFDFDPFYQSVKDKNYVILIFLSDPQPVPPFNINKSGFGSAAAWLTLPNVASIAL